MERSDFAVGSVVVALIFLVWVSAAGFGSDSVPVPLGPYTHSHLLTQFKVSSTISVVAALGSDVLLPCRLIPEMNAEKMEIRWFKPRYRPYVHLYINGKDDYSIQMPQFANRTELLKENITRGIFPLKIRNVTAQDSGEYYCLVESSDHHGRTTVQLQVTAVGSLPVISPNTYTSNDTAFCESCGWLPEPSLIWTDTQGNRVIPSKEKVYRDEKSLYCIFSIISLPDSSNITCTVLNSVNQSKYHSKQIRETGLPVTCRDQYSRYIVFWPCLAALIVSFGYIYHQSKELKRLRAELDNSPVNGICAAGYTPNGCTPSDHGTHGNVPSAPVNGICAAGYTPNGCTPSDHGTHGNVPSAPVNGICAAGYTPNGCTPSDHGTHGNVPPAPVNGICAAGYTPNGCTPSDHGTHGNVPPAPVNGICAAGYTPNGCTPSDHGTHGNVPSAPVNGICAAGYVPNGSISCDHGTQGKGKNSAEQNHCLLLHGKCIRFELFPIGST
uniref:Ig-like domain-containing protein n=1 Tax=Xenopus tropicalis TaxID=8364 RepID=A0A803K5F6_XENTR